MLSPDEGSLICSLGKSKIFHKKGYRKNELEARPAIAHSFHGAIGAPANFPERISELFAGIYQIGFRSPMSPIYNSTLH